MTRVHHKPWWIVITTIHEPNDFARSLVDDLGDDWGVVVVGDARTPALWDDVGVDYLSLETQRARFGDHAALAPSHHYSRKNFGYLHAQQHGAAAILEVDDDSVRRPAFAAAPTRTVCGRLVGGGDWANAYAWFTDRLIWPRGLPLDAIHRRGDLLAAEESRECPIQQFLVDDDPDVDAIFRHVFRGTGCTFDALAAPLVLEPGTWCPFNSQNTLWFDEAFPLLYLPHFATFRVCDIWRSLVAQRALWLAGRSLAFRTPTLGHRRNPHDLGRDLVDEIPLYTQNRAVADCLDRAARALVGASTAEAGRLLWLALVDAGFLPANETALIHHWFDAIVRPARDPVRLVQEAAEPTIRIVER